MAEAMFKDMVKEESDQWTIDSAATSTYQIGNTPDERTNKVLELHGAERNRHRARQVCF